MAYFNIFPYIDQMKPNRKLNYVLTQKDKIKLKRQFYAV